MATTRSQKISGCVQSAGVCMGGSKQLTINAEQQTAVQCMTDENMTECDCDKLTGIFFNTLFVFSLNIKPVRAVYLNKV